MIIKILQIILAGNLIYSPFLTLQTLNYMNIYLLTKKNIKYPKYVNSTLQKMILTNSLIGTILSNYYFRKLVGMKEIVFPERVSGEKKIIEWAYKLQKQKNIDIKEIDLKYFVLISDIVTHWIPSYFILINYDKKKTKTNGIILNYSLVLFYYLTLFLQLKNNKLSGNIFEDIKRTYSLRTIDLIIVMIIKLLIDLNLHLLNPNLLINKIKLNVMRGRVKMINYLKKVKYNLNQKIPPLTKKLNQKINSINIREKSFHFFKNTKNTSINKKSSN